MSDAPVSKAQGGRPASLLVVWAVRVMVLPSVVPEPEEQPPGVDRRQLHPTDSSSASTFKAVSTSSTRWPSTRRSKTSSTRSPPSSGQLQGEEGPQGRDRAAEASTRCWCGSPDPDDIKLGHRRRHGAVLRELERIEPDWDEPGDRGRRGHHPARCPRGCLNENRCEQSVGNALDTVRKRVDAMGVAEPNIYPKNRQDRGRAARVCPTPGTEVSRRRADGAATRLQRDADRRPVPSRSSSTRRAASPRPSSSPSRCANLRSAARYKAFEGKILDDGSSSTTGCPGAAVHRRRRRRDSADPGHRGLCRCPKRRQGPGARRQQRLPSPAQDHRAPGGAHDAPRRRRDPVPRHGQAVPARRCSRPATWSARAWASRSTWSRLRPRQRVSTGQGTLRVYYAKDVEDARPNFFKNLPAEWRLPSRPTRSLTARCRS